uniref:Alpha N-terminal protein methyltransferase 1 n=1 Tax=Brassica campestris TaxID=3711 RepID=A0A3P6BGQ9_BRACM|nr:unnamed protein product [Brassica rapa]
MFLRFLQLLGFQFFFRNSLMPHAETNFFCVPLHEFTPAAQMHDVIWVHWCIGHLMLCFWWLISRHSVDQIKKKYGLPRKEMGAAKMAQSKLQDNLKKLQGISLKMMEMEDTAKSFSSTAKEHAVEFKKWSSKF